MSDKNLYRTCQAAVGKRVSYKGTDGNEYDRARYGKPVSGVGLVKEAHSSHGLCIIVERDGGELVCVDPREVKILG